MFIDELNSPTMCSYLSPSQIMFGSNAGLPEAILTMPTRNIRIGEASCPMTIFDGFQAKLYLFVVGSTKRELGK